MALSRGAWIGIIAGALGALVGVGTGVWVWLALPQAGARGRLSVRMDSRGPYVILASKAAAEKYGDAIAEAGALHPQAARLTFSPEDLPSLQADLRRPRRVMLSCSYFLRNWTSTSPGDGCA